ncbi:hypothetical protein HOG48_01280 [Candidatus Peregrinibacteria bacterium]|nr:hypothetical protein [Candidatus Peregrinibacteria bacterium]
MPEIQEQHIDKMRKDSGPETQEPEHEKLLREQQQRILVQTMGGGVFQPEHLKAMLDYAESCSKEDFQKMLLGDTAAGAPPLAENIMKERLWNMAVEDQNAKYSGMTPNFKNRLEAKIKSETSAAGSIDRRILMTETAWEMEYEKMHGEMPKDLKKDFKRYYGQYDRNRAMTKHGILMRDNPIPDCDGIIEKMRGGILKRIILEYTIVAKEHFPKNTLKLWTDHIEEAETPEEAIKRYNKLVGETGPNKIEGFVQKEQEFNERRDKLMKEKPAAHDFFLRLYNKQTQEKLYSKRDEVMDEAITHIDTAMKELSALTTDPEVLDLKKYDKLEDIIAQINTLKPTPTTSETPTTSTEKPVDQVTLERARREAEEELYKGDSEIQRLTIQEMALESAARATEANTHQSDEAVKRKQEKEMRHVRRAHLKDQMIHAIGHTEEKEAKDEKITDSDIKEELTVIGTDLNKGFHGKESRNIADLAEVLDDMQGEADREGLSSITGVSQSGKQETARGMKDTAERAQRRIEELKDQRLQGKVKEGKLDEKVMDLSDARETKEARKRRRQTVLKNRDHLRHAA